MDDWMHCPRCGKNEKAKDVKAKDWDGTRCPSCLCLFVPGKAPKLPKGFKRR